MWIPGHAEIKENYKADLGGKSALDMHVDTGIKISYTDLKEKIKKYIFKKWQEY